MSRLQKILLVFGFIIVVFGMGFLLYVVFFKPFVPGEDYNTNISEGINGLPKAGEDANLQTRLTGNGALPTSANSNENRNGDIVFGTPGAAPDGGTPVLSPVQSLTDSAAFFPSPSGDGSFIYFYSKTDGKFYKIKKNGDIELLTDSVFHQVAAISWSPDGSKAVLEYPDGANIVYDFQTKKQVTLPQHWTDFDFSPDNSTIVSKSLGLQNDNNFMIVSDPSGTRTRIIRELGANSDRVIPLWSPNNQIVGMYAEGTDFDRQEVFFIGQNNENFKSMLVEGQGFQGQWTPQGDKMLYSVHSSRTDNKPELWIVDANGSSIGRNRRQLKIETWAEKCAFYDNNTIYCAVPSRLETGAGYYPQEMDNANDVIYKINLNSGSKTLVARPEENHTMRNLLLSPDGQFLYFTDKTTGRLYQIPLR